MWQIEALDVNQMIDWQVRATITGKESELCVGVAVSREFWELKSLEEMMIMTMREIAR